MPNLLYDCNCDCAAELDLTDFPNSCGAESYGYPKLLFFMKPEGVIVGCSGDVEDGPTYSEMVAAIGAGNGDNHMIVVGPITNGVRAESERQEETGADTIDGMTDVISQTMQITGKLKFLDEGIRNDLEQLNCYDRLKMWVVTNTGWLFGGCNGYDVANFISAMLMDGFGTRSYIPLDYKFRTPCHDPAVRDDDYLTLVNEE